MPWRRVLLPRRNMIMQVWYSGHLKYHWQTTSISGSKPSLKRTAQTTPMIPYASAIRIHIKPALGHYKLASLTPAAIQQWVDSLKNEKGLSAQSMANFRGVLSGALKYAIYPCGYLKTNPCSLTRPPKVPVDPHHKMHIEHICVGDEWEDIRNHFNGTCYYLPLMICYYTGTVHN